MADIAHTNEGEPQRKPKKHNWGTKAILDAPVRETDHMLIVDVNPDSSSPLQYKLDKERGTAFLNGHPFQSAPQMLSALARKAALVEAQARRSSVPSASD